MHGHLNVELNISNMPDIRHTNALLLIWNWLHNESIVAAWCEDRGQISGQTVTNMYRGICQRAAPHVGLSVSDGTFKRSEQESVDMNGNRHNVRLSHTFLNLCVCSNIDRSHSFFIRMADFPKRSCHVLKCEISVVRRQNYIIYTYLHRSIVYRSI